MSNPKRTHFCNGEYCQVVTRWTKEHDYNEDGTHTATWVCNNCGRREAKRQFTLDNSPDRKPTPGQQRAIDGFRRYLEENLNDNPEYGDTITKFELVATGYDASWWLSAETEMMGLGEGNLLRALDHHYWHIFVGPRGALTAHSYPKSLEQFKGGRFTPANLNIK